jgi:hypothetical protein
MNDYVGKLLVEAKLGDLTREARGGQRMRAARSTGIDRRRGPTGRKIASGLWAIVVALLAALRTPG